MATAAGRPTAMVVALATAVAAVAAAHAGAEVVSLTGPHTAPMGAPGQEQEEDEHAVVLIQSACRSGHDGQAAQRRGRGAHARRCHGG
ncbi:unnamed protein product [Urochloa humidicola]